jgi:hypothetical protein
LLLNGLQELAAGGAYGIEVVSSLITSARIVREEYWFTNRGSVAQKLPNDHGKVLRFC